MTENFVQITVKTPKNQAANCMRTQKKSLLSAKKEKSIVEEKLIAHDQFFWVIPYRDDQDLKKITQRLALGETMIKKFYTNLFRWVRRGNKLAKKFKRGAKWVKRWIIKQLKKKTAQGNDQKNMISYVEGMSEDEVADTLVIDDQEDMDRLLVQDLITVKDLPDYHRTRSQSARVVRDT